MTKHGIRSMVAVGLALSAFGVLAGCADIPNDDQPAAARDILQEGAEGEVLAQVTPSDDAGELSGDHIKITAIKATGTGCPAGSWEAEKVPEGNAFTLTFSKYVIEAPPATTPTVSTLACELNLELQTPKGLSYAVTSMQYFGYANLSAGMKASLVANYAFTGVGVAPDKREFRHDFPVPHDTTYAVNDDIVARGVAPSWAPCNILSNLQIRTRLTLEQGNSETPGVLAIDNIDARSQAALKIGFRTGPCPVVRQPQRPSR